MKSRMSLLTLTVWITSILLVSAGVLVVLGIFNGALKWDLFGPKLQAILYGMFACCVALAFIGLGLTLVLGTQEIVRSFRVIRRHFEPETEARPEAPRNTYATTMLYILLVLAALVTALAGMNHVVQVHRTKVFKKLVVEQMEHFGAKLAGQVVKLQQPPRDHVPYEIYDLIHTLDGLSFVQRATLYLPDPADDSALWGYTAWREYRNEDGFARFFIAKDFEKAMKAALRGSADELAPLNSETGFTWYYVIQDDKGRRIGVLRIDGNPRENFREYFLGS
jgi:hypothetical protein